MGPTAEQSDVLVDMAATAPEEIERDTDVLARVATGLRDDPIEVDPDDPTAALEALRDLDVDAGQITGATARVEAYVNEMCSDAGAGR